ncbi:hypothetical protein LVJ94_28540 [Pendulispora rubella]|uniref:Uncharacterized protein n=1 Tax=Pendulispora rubella TaxID=2741070 RepID=A0ABZ2KQE2_9BACT
MTLAALAATLQGCSSSDGADGSGDADTAMYTMEEVIAALRPAYCEPLRDCCQVANHEYDASRCRAPIAWWWPGAQSAIPGLWYKGSVVRKCVDAVRARMALCTDTLASPDAAAHADLAVALACTNLNYGRATPGQSCEHDDDCADSGPGTHARCLSLEASPSPQNLKCYLTRWDLALGETCEGLSKDKVDRRVCDPLVGYCARPGNAPTGTCKPFYALGEPCDGDHCAYGGYCHPQTKVCTRLPGIGEACDYRHASCNADLTCIDAATNRSCDELAGDCKGTCKRTSDVALHFEVSRATCTYGPAGVP